jgi:NADH-quinone oxidoreductase subunit G
MSDTAPSKGVVASGTPEDAPVEGVPITVNGKELLADKGELLIDAAERHGVYIPRFCYHPRMRPVGMCRMCIVEVDTGRGPTLQPSCMLECTDGMQVDTQSDVTVKAQDGVLEFLLINHPLDCPVCDKGGECPLQDQTMAYGPGESRFVEEKRHFEKPIPISDLVLLDRERCILCDRCTRFASEVAGDPLIQFLHRGGQTEVNTYPDEPFSSYFSGNTIQICPVGALLGSPYRFRARPWDLETTESTCQTCAVGCRISIDSSRNEVLRYSGIDVDPVNWGWLCDKGRFNFQSIKSTERLTQPVERIGDGWQELRWPDALRAAANSITGALERGGPESIALIGGARLSNEAAYAWAKVAKGVIGTDNVDAQMGDGLPAEAVLGLPAATIDDVCRPKGTVVLLGPDLKEELPVLFLRLRHAVTWDEATVIEVSPHRTGTTDLAGIALHPRPGTQAHAVRAVLDSSDTGVPGGPTIHEATGVPPDLLRQAGALLDAAEGPITVVLGRQSLSESPDALVDAASVLLERRPDTRFLVTLRRGNVRGALDLGLAPGLLPGRVSVDEGRDWFERRWPSVPAQRGLDTAGILRAAAEGRIETLVLIGADPMADFPDADLASRALAGARSVVAVDLFLTESSRRAHIVLPAAGFAEVSGTTTNLEGRVTTLSQRVTAPGTAQPDWVIAADLALELGHDLGFESVHDVWREIEAVAPAHAGLTLDLLGTDAGRNGVVVPMATASTASAPVAADQPADELPAEPDSEQPETTGDRAEAEALPPLVVFTPTRLADPPAVDNYSLRLILSRKLYDQGVQQQRSPSLAPLAAGTSVRVSPSDFDRLGVERGSRVRVVSARGEITAVVHVDPGVPRGCAALYVNQADAHGTALVDVDERVVDVRIERGAE